MSVSEDDIITGWYLRSNSPVEAGRARTWHKVWVDKKSGREAWREKGRSSEKEYTAIVEPETILIKFDSLAKGRSIPEAVYDEFEKAYGRDVVICNSINFCKL